MRNKFLQICVIGACLYPSINHAMLRGEEIPERGEKYTLARLSQPSTAFSSKSLGDGNGNTWIPTKLVYEPIPGAMEKYPRERYGYVSRLATEIPSKFSPLMKEYGDHYRIYALPESLTGNEEGYKWFLTGPVDLKDSL